MADRLLREQQRLIAEVRWRADAERNSWRFRVQLVLSNCALTLAPLSPQSELVFGQLTSAQAVVFLTPAMFMVFVSTWLYRRLGSDSAWYQASEAVETFLLYVLPLGLIYHSKIQWSVLWALFPFIAIFWALTKPFHHRMYIGIITLAHGAITIALILRGTYSAAGLCVGVGLVTMTTVAAISRSRRAEVMAEADRNVVRTRLNESLLEEERERIARALAEGVSQRLAALVESLRPLVAAHALSAETVNQAEVALREISNIVSPSRTGWLPRTIGELGQMLETKCRPLCMNLEYQQTLAGDAGMVLESSIALAALRIVQELVRNAVTHASAHSIGVTVSHDEHSLDISVRDDGRGLTLERFNRATGGLQNARRWSSEQGGLLLREETARGTHLLVRLLR